MSISKRCEFCRPDLPVDQSRIAAMFLEPCRRRLAVPRLLPGSATPLLIIVLVVLGPTLSAQSVDPQQQQQQQPQSELSQLSLEQLADLPIDSVFSASMYTQKVTEAPSSVTIITANEIRGFGHRTLADVLRTVRGFYVTYDRNYSYLGVRGFSRPGDYNARVLLQMDGHRLNDNVFGSALLGTEFPLDVDLIERIEIIRGPSSALYGTSAFFAVINVITKRGSTEQRTRSNSDARKLRRLRGARHLQPTVRGGSGTAGVGDRLSQRRSTHALLSGVRRSGYQQRHRRARRQRSVHETVRARVQQAT